jgi:hypothetical protein
MKMMITIIIIIIIIINNEIKENVRLKIEDDTEDYTNGVNSCKRDTNVIKHENRETKKVIVLSLVKWKIKVLKESSTQLGIN